MLAAVLTLAFAVAFTTGSATAGCEGFAWSVEQERAWFAAEGGERVQSGATLPHAPQAAILVEPVPLSQIAWAHAPARPAPTDRPGAIIFIGKLDPPGVWQITLSGPAWIDVVQNGKLLPSIAHTGDHSGTCKEMKKSVRFEIGRGPAAIQLSGARPGALRLALRRIE